MKNDKLIVALSQLLKVDKNVIVEALNKEEGDDGLIKTFLDKNNVFTLDDVARMKQNSKAEALTELEKMTEFPSAIYNRVKGLAFEKAEKEAAKKYGIESWSNFNDLLAKIAAVKGEGTDSEKDKQITMLKQALSEKEAEIETKVKEVENKYTADFTARDFEAAVASIKLDGEEEAVKNQQKLLKGAFNSEYKTNYKEGKTVVLDAKGEVVKDKLGDPLPVSEVYKSFALSHGAKLKEADPGGRGDGSSGKDKNLLLKGKSFTDVLIAKNVKPNTDEADKLFVEYQAANKN